MPGFKSKQSVEDMNKILASNYFIKSYCEEHKKATIQDCFKVATDYMAKFDRTGEADMFMNNLIRLFNNFCDFQKFIAKAQNFEIGTDDRDKCLEAAKNKFESLIRTNPQFHKQMQTFIDMATKTSSYGDEGLQMIVSMANTFMDFTDYMSMQEPLDRALEWKEALEMFSDYGQKIDESINEFVIDCKKNDYDGHNLDDSKEALEKNKQELEAEYNKIIEEDNKKSHDEEYVEISNRMSSNSLDDSVYMGQENALRGRLERIDQLEKSLNTVKIELAHERIAFDRNTTIQREVEEFISNKDKEIEEQLKKSEPAEKAQNFLDRMSMQETKKIDSANLLEQENAMLGDALKQMEELANQQIEGESIDFTQPYKLCSGNGQAFSTLKSTDQLAIEKYIDIKRQLNSIDPTLAKKFDAYEKTENIKIPGDFDKVIGSELKARMQDNEAYIEQVHNEPFYKQYVDANKTIAEHMETSDTLKDLRAEKEELVTRLKNATERRNQAREFQTAWKKEFKDELGEKLPSEDKIDIRSVEQALKAEKESIKKDLNGVVDKRKEINKQIGEDTQRLGELKQGLAPAKATALKNKIDVLDAKIANHNKLTKSKKNLNETLEAFDHDRGVLIEGAKSALTTPYNIVKNRLKNIYEHFNDVQSFFSKGMTTECQNMYDNLGRLVRMLDGEGNPTKEQLLSSFQTVKSFAQDYYDAKKAQNIPKIFASNQRNWRLAKTEELMGILDNTVNVLGQIKPEVQLSMESFVKENEKILGQDQGKLLDNHITAKQKAAVQEKKIGLEIAPQQKVQTNPSI